jgi:hypothetical protein
MRLQQPFVFLWAFDGLGAAFPEPHLIASAGRAQGAREPGAD